MVAFVDLGSKLTFDGGVKDMISGPFHFISYLFSITNIDEYPIRGQELE